MKYIKLRHKVFEARWEETEHVWKLRIQDSTSGESFDDSCDIFIYACGHLNHWVWPDIPGMDEYEGDLVHSANWVRTYSKQIFLHAGHFVSQIIAFGSTKFFLPFELSQKMEFGI